MWIRIHSLSLFAHHGVYEEERRSGNQFEIDVEILVPDSFGIRDDLRSTLDYVRIVDMVKEISERTTYTLLERFCLDLCTAIFALDEAISESIVRIRKLAPPMNATVGSVEIERRIVR